MATATGQTAYRSLGDVPYKVWHDTIVDAGGPVGLASIAAWEQTRPHSLLALRMLLAESTYGSAFKANPASNQNPWNIKWRAAYGESRRGANGYVKYGSWTEAAADWKKHITSAPYDHLTTIAELVHTYAPDTDNNNERDYVQKIVTGANTLPREGGQPVPELTFGNVKMPPVVVRLIPDKQTRRWDDLGPRKPIGICQHSMIGTLRGTDEWFRNPAGNGLTDYGIGGSTDGDLDGVIYQWNDPFGLAHTGVSPNRSGWANGGSDGLEGDGIAFVRKLGVNAINRNLASIERSDGGNTNTPISPKQFKSMTELSAAIFDHDSVPWDQFPLNPKYDLVTYLFHLEFATKGCPYAPVINRVNEIQDRIRAILKAGQTTTGTTPTVPPVTVPNPDTKWPNGWTTELLAKQFGTVILTMPDGTKKPQHFDEDGPISNAWAAQGAALGIKKIADLPPPLGWTRYTDKEGLMVDLLVFDGTGTDNWMLLRPAPTVAWRWIR